MTNKQERQRRQQREQLEAIRKERLQQYEEEKRNTTTTVRREHSEDHNANGQPPQPHVTRKRLRIADNNSNNNSHNIAEQLPQQPSAPHSGRDKEEEEVAGREKRLKSTHTSAAELLATKIHMYAPPSLMMPLSVVMMFDFIFFVDIFIN